MTAEQKPAQRLTKTELCHRRLQERIEAEKRRHEQEY